MEISEDNFLECMAAEFPNFKITKGNLTHLTSQFVLSYYSLILKHTIDVTETEELWNITKNQYSYINSYQPEAVIFSHHVWAHNLYSAVKYVFDQISDNGSGFAFSDILFPEYSPRRSLVFMSLMLNFYFFSTDFADDLNNDITACIQANQAIEKLKKEKEEIVKQLEELECQKSIYAESYKDKKKTVAKNTEANEQKEKIMKDLLTEEEVIQREVDKREEEEQKCQERLTKYKNEKKYLESLIVSNENQVKDCHEKLVVYKDKCVKKMKILEEQAKAGSNKVMECSKVLEFQQKLNSFLKEDKTLIDENYKNKSFQNLHKENNALLEKKRKVVEEKLILCQKILEAKEQMSKLKNDEAALEKEKQEIITRGKGKVSIQSNAVEEHKKNHSAKVMYMKQGFEDMDKFTSASLEKITKCGKLEKEIKSLESKNENMYKNYCKEMKETLNSIKEFFM